MTTNGRASIKNTPAKIFRYFFRVKLFPLVRKSTHNIIMEITSIKIGSAPDFIIVMKKN